MTGTDSNRQRVTASLLDEVFCFGRVREQLIHTQFARCSDTILFASFPCFKGTKATQFALDGDAAGVGHIHRTLGDINIVFVAGRVF